MKNIHNRSFNALSHYLSPLEVWALSFGCAVGWGAFVMPGTTFLPFAGPYGTAIGMILGAFIMLIIGINYHFLMNRYPDAGGTLTYSIRAFGFNHGLLSAWFLILVYIAIMWANATAIVLINTPANAFKFLMAISVCVPFLGRAAIGWIVDVNTIGALIAYAYTSAAACKIAKNDGHKPIVFTGIIGTVISAVFFFYFLIPNIWSAGNLSSESYLILIIWSIFGLAFFMFVFKHNEQIHFGKSITLWLTLLFMIFLFL
ncbi:MAG: hypothetical protein K6G84_01375 [Lachnospiraceae bacterium]|nr:hypothetical protein [Lachnospiraceae bacterium]